MDAVRERMNELNKNRRLKMILALIIVVALIMCVVAIEFHIYNNVVDITIMKEDISDEKASFISVKPLDTNIIAVKTSDGKYNLAFDDCLSCYNQYGKHYGFKNNENRTGLICKNCKNEVSYDSMGFVPEGCMPFPITVKAESGIQSFDDRFVFSAEYLERMKDEFSRMRTGKSLNNYRENPNK